MKLLEKLKKDLRESLLKRDAKRASLLRIVLSSVKNFEIEKGSMPDDSEVISVIKSEIRKTKDSISEFSKAGRVDLVEKEQNDLEILMQYVPAQMSEDDTRKLVKKVLAEISPAEKEYGRIMSLIMREYKDEVEGAIVGKIVSEELSITNGSSN